MNTLSELLTQLKQCTWVDLTHEVHPEIPYFQSFQPIEERTLFSVAKDGFFAKEYKIVTQYGTHLDAPIHFSEGKRYLEELELKELVLPLVVIHKQSEVLANHDYELTVADILALEDTYGPIPPDSFVAFASGWSNRWTDQQAYYNVDDAGQAHTPGWSLEALHFLHEERAVRAIGHETLDTDRAIDCTKNGGLLGELYWLSQNKYQVEVLTNLEAVPAIGSLIMIGVPKIAKAPGFTARAVAIVPALD